MRLCTVAARQTRCVRVFVGLLYIHATWVHEARVLRVRVKAARDVHRVYTYEIYAPRVGTGSKQPMHS